MERLTKRIDGGVCHYDCTDTCSSCDGCACFDVWKMLDKLAAYEDAEEQGRLVALPCYVGAKVFCIESGKIYECWVTKYIIGYDGVEGFYITGESFTPTYKRIAQFGKRVFLTHEDAEAALKEMEGK